MLSVPIKLNVANRRIVWTVGPGSAGAFHHIRLRHADGPVASLGRVSQCYESFSLNGYTLGSCRRTCFRSRHVTYFAPTAISTFDFRRLITCNLRWFRESRRYLNTLTLGLSATIALALCGSNRDSSKRIK